MPAFSITFSQKKRHSIMQLCCFRVKYFFFFLFHQLVVDMRLLKFVTIFVCHICYPLLIACSYQEAVEFCVKILKILCRYCLRSQKPACLMAQLACWQYYSKVTVPSIAGLNACSKAHLPSGAVA